MLLRTRRMLSRDPWSILGVSKSASKEEIKKQYLEQAKKYHPDVNKSSEAAKKFQEIQQAYSYVFALRMLVSC